MKHFTLFHSMLVILAIGLCLPQSGIAQSSSKAKNIAPLWVKMMEDPNTNYYAAIKEYDNFWKGKEKPTDEEAELMSKGPQTVQEHIHKMSKREIKEQRLLDYYRYECKRFENWRMINKPYVQNDGHILTADERMKIWEQTQKSKQ